MNLWIIRRCKIYKNNKCARNTIRSYNVKLENNFWMISMKMCNKMKNCTDIYNLIKVETSLEMCMNIICIYFSKETEIFNYGCLWQWSRIKAHCKNIKIFCRLSTIVVCYFADFNQDGQPDNISFMIKRIKVHGEDALNDPSYRFTGTYGVEEFLELFSGE